MFPQPSNFTICGALEIKLFFKSKFCNRLEVKSCNCISNQYSNKSLLTLLLRLFDKAFTST